MAVQHPWRHNARGLDAELRDFLSTDVKSIEPNLLGGVDQSGIGAHLDDVALSLEIFACVMRGFSARPFDSR